VLCWVIVPALKSLSQSHWRDKQSQSQSHWRDKQSQSHWRDSLHSYKQICVAVVWHVFAFVVLWTRIWLVCAAGWRPPVTVYNNNNNNNNMWIYKVHNVSSRLNLRRRQQVPLLWYYVFILYSLAVIVTVAYPCRDGQAESAWLSTSWKQDVIQSSFLFDPSVFTRRLQTMGLHGPSSSTAYCPNNLNQNVIVQSKTDRKSV